MLKTINYFQKSIAYQIEGEGKPIVFLHGFGENRTMWNGFKKYFTDYQLITPDLPGSGDSEPIEASTARMAKIVRQILKKESIKKCVLVGHSMGGYVSLAFAQLYPNMLKGLVLFHSQAHPDKEEKKAARNKSINFVKKNGVALYFKGLIPKLFPPDFRKKHPFVMDKLIHAASRTSKEGVINQLIAMRDRPGHLDTLAHLDIPVCFIIGKLDEAVSFQNSLEQTHQPEISDIHILEKVGHMGMFEQEVETAKIIRRFLNFLTYDQPT